MRPCRSAAYGLTLRILGDASLAEEAVRAGFISVWQSAATFECSQGGAHNWVLSLVHRRAVDLLRRSGLWREQPEQQAMQPPRTVVAGFAGPCNEGRTVENALEALPAEQRAIIELAYYGGYTQTRIAAHLNQPIGSVRKQTADGLRRLRAIVAP